MKIPRSLREKLVEQWDSLQVVNGESWSLLSNFDYVEACGKVEGVVTVRLSSKAGPNSFGIRFLVDDTLPNDREYYFSGDIKSIGKNEFYLPADSYTLHINEMLMQINSEIIDGYMLANRLLVPLGGECWWQY